jgi:hypothetical protein
MPVRNQPTTPQDQQNVLNLITKNTPAGLMTVDFENLTKNARKIVDEVAEANRKRFDPDGERSWRSELEELNRRLIGSMDVSDAKTYSDNQEQIHKDAVKVIEGELKYANDLLATPGLSRCTNRRENREPLPGDSCDLCKFSRLLEVVGLKLAHVKRKQQLSIRVCGGIIAAAKELDPLRPRWEELKKRDKSIAQARRSIRDHTQLQPERNQSVTRRGFTPDPGGFETYK